LRFIFGAESPVGAQGEMSRKRLFDDRRRRKATGGVLVLGNAEGVEVFNPL